MSTYKLSKIIFVLSLALFALLAGCNDMDSIQKPYLTGEKVYAGKLDSLRVYSGYNEVKITGQTRYLGHSNKCFVEWDDQQRAFPIQNIKNGIFEMIVGNLDEHNYEFVVYTTDAEGNKSVLQTCSGKAVGPIFVESQMPRRVVKYDFVGGYFSAVWADKAESEFVVYTDFSFEGTDGEMHTLRVMPDDVSTPLMGWKASGKTEIVSSVVTSDMGIDTVALAPTAALPLPNSTVFELNKANFKVVHLSHDTNGNGYGGKIPGMWDGVKGSAEGSRYHTNDGEGVPHTLTFDVGVVETLVKAEITGREGYNDWNPRRIQFWGCEDIEGKDTDLPADDAGWEAESLSKGWVLLLDQTLADPYQNTVTFDVSKTENVRYIRLRPMTCVGAGAPAGGLSGKGVYGCIQELTLWGEDIRPASN